MTLGQIVKNDKMSLAFVKNIEKNIRWGGRGYFLPLFLIPPPPEKKIFENISKVEDQMQNKLHLHPKVNHNQKGHTTLYRI